MRNLKARIAAILLLGLAMLSAGAGLILPVHFGSLGQSVVERAGQGTETLAQRAELLLDFGKTGPAARLLDAIPDRNQGDTKALLRERIARLRAEHPHFHLTGGAAPYMEQWVAQAPRVPEQGVSVLKLLAPSSNRADLREFLQSSSSEAVQTILRTRNMTGMTRFLPVGTSGGAPLEVSILATALLAQGNYLQPAVAVDLSRMARRVDAGEADAVADLERWYLAVLGAGRQSDWLQLAEWAGTSERASDFERTVALARRFPGKLPSLYAAVLLSEKPGAVADYLDAHGLASGWRDLELALDNGAGALNLLLNDQEPVYQPPGWLRWTDNLTTPGIAGFVLAQPLLALVAKVGLFVLGGIFLALAVSQAVRVEAPGEIHMWHPFDFVRHLLLASVAAVILVYAGEPGLLAARAELPSTLNFKVFLAQGTEKPVGSTFMKDLDQITLLVLLIFFALQLVIYLICLIRIAKIKRQQAPAALKVKLLENEETLFDSGLYVGLSGTVASLILLAMGIVDASLVAAYASTLFGIIFVAVLKIFHVRPYRRGLIIEAEKWGR